MHATKIYLLLLLIILSANVFSKDVESDDILGFWLSESGRGVIQVYKEGDTYNGKLVWLMDKYTGKVAEPLDKENPDDKLKSRPLDGLKNLVGFKFDKDEWTGGTIYDPKSGKTYKAYMSLADDSTLKLRGYVGVPLFGRTSEWKRQKSAIPDEHVKEDSDVKVKLLENLNDKEKIKKIEMH